MANKLYGKGAEKTLGKQIDWLNDDLRILALSSSYVPDLVNHEWYSDVSAYLIASPVALTTKSITGGIFKADDVNLTLLSGTCKSLVIYKYNATPGAAALLAYIDSVLNLPLTSTGGILPIKWPSAGIVSLIG